MPAPSPLAGSFSSPAFRRFFAARTLSQWGDTFNTVAIVVLVYQLTGSGLTVAATVGAEIVPALAFGLWAGAVVDRFSRRSVMVGADLVRAAIAALLAGFHGQLWMVYGSAFGLSASTPFFSPAAASVVPSLVGERDVVAANTAIWSAAVVSQVALAPAAGALVALAGAGPAFALNATSFAASAALLVGVPTPPAVPPTPAGGPSQMLEGFRAIRSARFLSTLAVVQSLAALSAGATSALLVVLAERHLHVGPTRFGVLLAAIGVGAGIGPIVIEKLIRDVRRGGWLFGPYLLRGVVDLNLATWSSFPAAVGALGAYGIATSTGNITYHSVLQTSVPDRIRGRVFASYGLVWQSSRLASIVIGGVLADTIGIAAVYYFGGALLLVAGAAGIAVAGHPPEPGVSPHSI